MQAFSSAFNQVFIAIALFFTVIEKLFKTADNLATVAEESSGTYKDQARIQRRAKLAALNKEHSTTVTMDDQPLLT
jgi:hypothetical protein